MGQGFCERRKGRGKRKLYECEQCTYGMNRSAVQNKGKREARWYRKKRRDSLDRD